MKIGKVNLIVDNFFPIPPIFGVIIFKGPFLKTEHILKDTSFFHTASILFSIIATFVIL